MLMHWFLCCENPSCIFNKMNIKNVEKTRTSTIHIKSWSYARCQAVFFKGHFSFQSQTLCANMSTKETNCANHNRYWEKHATWEYRHEFEVLYDVLGPIFSYKQPSFFLKLCADMTACPYKHSGFGVKSTYKNILYLA